jgi:hypothetical protein
MRLASSAPLDFSRDGRDREDVLCDTAVIAAIAERTNRVRSRFAISAPLDGRVLDDWASDD